MAEEIGAGQFGSRDSFSIGVEEELFLVEPGSGRLANVAPAVIAAVGDVAPASVKSELHACHIELITGVCATAREAAESLVELRRRVVEQGVGLVGSGTHPAALEGEAEITRSKRYELIEDLLGDAVATPVGAMHVHVGMPDPEAAIRAFNGLRTHLPMLEALGANSPFRHGRDTGFASSRAMTIRAWPRSGVPRAMRDFADFKDYADRLTRVAGVPDYTFHWWKLRPHPRLGTVEIRALDAQASARETAGLAALVQCLARHEANGDSPEGPPPEVLEEVSYQAAREGVGGSVSGIGAVARHDTSELAAETIAVARTVAAELDCEAELSLLDSVIEQGGGAGRQRAAHAESGIDGVLRRLMDVADAPVQLDP